MQWKQAIDGVMITRISKVLNPDHPYRNYLGDPKTDTPYRKSKDGGFCKIDRPEKACPPIVWESDEVDSQEPARKPKRRPVLTLNVYQEGNRLTFEVQPVA